MSTDPQPALPRPAAPEAATAPRHLPLLAAAEVWATGSAPHHAVPDVGPLTGSVGLSLCGRVSGEETVLLPDTGWAAVPAEHRCPDCDRAAVAGCQTWPVDL